MTWQLSEADRKRIAADVARQLARCPGPLPQRAAQQVLAALRALSTGREK